MRRLWRHPVIWALVLLVVGLGALGASQRPTAHVVAGVRGYVCVPAPRSAYERLWRRHHRWTSIRLYAGTHDRCHRGWLY